MISAKSKEFIFKKVLSIYIPLAVIMTFILTPFYWTIITAFKNEGDIVKSPVQYLPIPPTLSNFSVVWKQVGFNKFFFNSILVSVVSAVIITIISIMVGYALSRFRFKGKQIFMLVLLCTQFIPGAMLIIPLFLIFKNLGLINNLFSLVLVYITFQIPFNSIVMRGFISGIPVQLEEAAMIDGCGRLKAIRIAVLPILLPGIVATSAFAFVGCWNEFLYALMFINRSRLFTIPVGLSSMQGEFQVFYGALAAGSIIAIIPAVLMFAYIQKYLVQGLSSGSVKG